MALFALLALRDVTGPYPWWGEILWTMALLLVPMELIRTDAINQWAREVRRLWIAESERVDD
jgi:hypothetical protein